MAMCNLIPEQKHNTSTVYLYLLITNKSQNTNRKLNVHHIKTVKRYNLNC